MRKMIRGEKGRYTGAEMEPEIKQRIEKENAHADKLIAAVAKVGMSPEIIDIKTFENGNRWIGVRTVGILFGVFVGIAFALKEGRTLDEKIAALNELDGALKA